MDSSIQQYSIEDLAQFMRATKADGKPYVFITGAGCSVTAGIPLANQIVKEMNEQFSLELKSLSDEERKDYGKCMECIEVSKRRTYLKAYIDKAKINWAHIALACLIKEGYIRRILTFNFDNLLARSCGLLGLYPATYDFTAANLNLHSLIDDPSIVHLHGQGHGFVQLNTQSETDGHAKRLREFVRHTLNESPTLFIGYSGQNDAFLPQIEEQFSDQHRMFWVDMGMQAPEHLQKSILRSHLAHYMNCRDGADTFLIQLAQALDCFPPTIFVDPYQHLLDELDEIANYPMPKEKASEGENERQLDSQNDDTQDILLETKNKLREVQQQDKVWNTNFLKEYLEGNYEEIIQILEIKQSLDHEESLWLARSYFDLALREHNAEEQVKIYEKLIDKFKESNELDIQEQVAKALMNKAIVLEKLGQIESAVDVCNELIARFRDSNEFTLQKEVAKALNGISYSLLLEAKKQWGNPDVAQDYLNKALKDLSIALTLLSENYHSMVLGNIAYVEFLLGETTQSKSHLQEALQQGGQFLFDETIKDIGKHPIDLDVDFKWLLESTWKELNK